MRNLTKLVLAVVLTAGVGVGRAEAAAINLTTPGLTYFSGSYTLGFEFTVNQAISLTSLGIFDNNLDGLPSGASVGLWLSDGTLLRSAVVPSGTSGVLDGMFRYVSVASVALTPGVNYVIGAFLAGNCADCLATSLGTGQGGTGSVDAAVNVIRDRYTPFDFAFGFPTSTDSHAGGAWLGANFRFNERVPEPGTLALVGLGLAFAGYRGLRRRS